MVLTMVPITTVDKFTGRKKDSDGDGKDILCFLNLTRYDIKFKDTDLVAGSNPDTWVITDHLARDKGGDGIIWQQILIKFNLWSI